MIDQNEQKAMQRIIDELLQECMASDDALNCAIETIEMIPADLEAWAASPQTADQQLFPGAN